jgi:hypothetical protein
MTTWPRAARCRCLGAGQGAPRMRASQQRRALLLAGPPRGTGALRAGLFPSVGLNLAPDRSRDCRRGPAEVVGGGTVIRQFGRRRRSPEEEGQQPRQQRRGVRGGNDRETSTARTNGGTTDLRAWRQKQKQKLQPRSHQDRHPLPLQQEK